MGNYMFEKLKNHVGHDIACVSYGDPENPSDICIECEDCCEVLVSAETFDEDGTTTGINDSSETEALVNEVERLNNSIPDGVVYDSDTVLADAIDNCNYHFNGLSQDIFNIWKNSTDKESVERMFYEFTDMEFKDFLEKCINEISR